MMLFPSSRTPAPLTRSGVVVFMAALAYVAGLSAQELEPRRWGHLPVGSNFAGIGYVRTEGDIALDPVLRLEDVEVELDTAALKYIHTFGLLGKSARFDLVQAYQRGNWSFEFTGSTWLFTENDDFFGGRKVEQDPLVTLQGHVIHTFRPGLWLGASLGYDFGGQSAIDGIKKNDSKELLSWAITCGIPVNRSVGLKFGYIYTRTRRQTGADLGNFVSAVSVMW